MFNLGSSLMNRYKQIAGISVATVILLLIFVPIQNKQSLSTVGSPSPYEVQGVSPQLQSQAADNALKAAGAPPQALGAAKEAFLAETAKGSPQFEITGAAAAAGSGLWCFPRTSSRSSSRNSGYCSRCSLSSEQPRQQVRLHQQQQLEDQAAAASAAASAVTSAGGSAGAAAAAGAGAAGGAAAASAAAAASGAGASSAAAAAGSHRSSICRSSGSFCSRGRSEQLQQQLQQQGQELALPHQAAAATAGDCSRWFISRSSRGSKCGCISSNNWRINSSGFCRIS